ncbi:Na+/H+ antiporter subunit D [Caldalkalibacillus salinus]|uniref:Na+/H+ antiporter subunit D n=1 Tax=Caldalkalibacillus salinus TaxID=2803787 RepID=UPI001924452B|nr:Na+/H+ antiporter subunit D [Caldalkalibacillus salinus]
MNNNIVLLPLLIPFVTGVILIFFKNQIRWQKILSILSFLGMTGVSLYLTNLIANEGIQTLYLGGWEPPYGIVLVADMFAALLVLTTSIVALCCSWFAFSSIGKEREKFYFYPMFQFLIVGVSGSFLTGDLFNLFVFFEVMLISSYVMIGIGGTKRQLRESLKYVLINIVSSALFVASVAYLYAITGTLNMAQLSQRIAEAYALGEGTAIITVVSILLMIVFSLKAGLFLYYWLPGSYSAPPMVIAAVFGALLTKVGIYALFRTFTLIFYHQQEVTHYQILGWLAALTSLLGVIGAVAHSDVRKILSYNIVAAVGFIVLGLAVFSHVAISGAIYYLIHDMIIKALLFLLGGALIGIAGTSHVKKMGGLIKHHPYPGWMFFIGAVALAGIPPLSGFLGKLLVIQGSIEQGATHGLFYLFAGISLFSSLLILYSVMKIFMHGFWGETKLTKEEEYGTTKGLLAPCSILLLVSFFLGLGGEYVLPYVFEAADTLMNPSIYIDAVGIKE